MIKTKLPANITNDLKWIFKRRQNYSFPKLAVKEKTNVFLTHYGIMLKNLLPVKRTLPNTWGFKKPNAGFFFKFYRKGIETYLVCRFGKSLESINLDTNKKYLFVYSPWFGYFSWVTESLPRIITTKKNHKELTLILPESYARISFVMDSLKLFPELKHQIIPDGVHMKIPQVIIPELKPFTYSFEPTTMKEYRQIMWDFISDLKIDIPTFDRIYVSRKKAKSRKLTNEKEVLEVLQKNNFQEVNFEDYNFYEQIYLMKNCSILCGVHGAGFANIAFMKEETTLVELIKEYSSYREERPSYWRLCSALNIHYYIEYCKPIKYGKYDLWVSVDLIANITTLKNTIEKITNYE